MTAPLRGTSHASAIAAIAASQNSAPVAEFRCLFTHDIRRKQKRWQDGFLKFHTFNNRVMVYDQARNFLGDTYYKDSDQLHEGDELNLNNGALVEVSEPVGITHTDLTPVLSKKTRDQPPGPRVPSQTKPFQRPSSAAPANAQKPSAQLRHKSLNTLLGTPKGPIGKAQPIKSPYEARKAKEKENESDGERAAKRQRTGQAPASWKPSSPAQDEDLETHEQLPTLTRAAGARNARQPTTFIPPAATIITLDSEPDPLPTTFSDVTLPSTPPQAARRREESRTAKPAVARRLPAQTPKLPKGKVPLPGARALETPQQPAPPSSPPVSASNRLSNIEFALQPAKVPRKEPSPPPAPSSPPPRKTKCLRLSAGVKRGKLLCQALPSQIAKAGSGPRVAGTKAKRINSNVGEEEEEEALTAIAQKDRLSAPTKSPSRAKRILADTDNDAPKRVRVSKSPSLLSPSLQEDPEIIQGLMDEQLLVNPSPVHPHLASSPPVDRAPRPGPTAKKTAGEIFLQENTTEPASANSKSLMTGGTNRKRHAENRAEKLVAASRAWPPSAATVDPAIPPSRDLSPARNEASDTQSRTSLTSRKLPRPTGAASKRAVNRTKKQSLSTNSKPDALLSPPQNESASHPPQPLRANKKGPLMSTTELAGLLQKSKNLAKALADPIEDEGNVNGDGKPSNRSFRRVRSENDAPIPSVAEDWEKRNLPTSDNRPVTDVANEPATAETTVGAVTKKKKKDSGLDALIKRTDPRRKFKKSQSLQVQTDLAPQPGIEEEGQEVELQSPVVDVDVGPWSTEAGDLFDWRPPGRD